MTSWVDPQEPRGAPGGARDRHLGERGSGSVLALGQLTALLLLLMGLLAIGSAAIAAHRARTAADLAALAGARRAQVGGGPSAACAVAQTAAAINGALLRECLVRGSVVEVTVIREVGLGTWVPVTPGIGKAQASARAGPVYTGP